MLDPLLQMCTVSASNLGTADMATFMVNSLYMMKTTLALFEFTDKRLEMLQFQVSFNSPERKRTFYWFLHTVSCDVNIFILKSTQSQRYQNRGNGIRGLLVGDYKQIASFILNRQKMIKRFGFVWFSCR